MQTVLLTGFEAFGNTPVNPAESVTRALDGAHIDDSEVVGVVVPNTFFECIEVVRASIEEVQPEIVIMMGEYGGRAIITVERIAQNFNDSTRYQLQDNRGVSMQGEPTIPNGPLAYQSTLPLRAMVKAMRAVGVPSDISDAPGTFCCNHLMYGILHHIAANDLNIRAGWIHLPHLPEVAALPENLGAPSMSCETAILGIRAGIQATLKHQHDIAEPSLSRLQI
ncbi:MAG: pyroglutamyl-peptidase I [Candidatus Competibacteraceae bacterium]|nr:pyroglutamyl-peptidase I [Candidatus Competibacteraceae bacterium]MCB1811045.1 pyroglutamyl-peptidase I [Candidatus Competibacteraceae bacterium]